MKRDVSRVTNEINPLQLKDSDDVVLLVDDLFLTKEHFQIKKNREFGLLYTYPQPLDNLDKYYESEEYISHTDSKKSIFDRAYQFIKTRNLNYKYELIRELNPGKMLLDFGCGTGDFLKVMQEKGYEVTGIEPNLKARILTAEKIGKENVFNKDLSELEQNFDVITLWHVLEHIPDLFETIHQLKSLLNPNGILIIAVPNHESYDAKYYKEFWAAYDVPRHLWHFSAKSIKSIMQSFGMNLVKTRPLKFDSFYVSLLSEKYKGNPKGIFNAFTVGFKSNQKAQKTGEYSSLVYIFNKKT